MQAPRDVLEANVALVDDIVDGVCRRARVFGADAEDFASSVKLALVENDYAVLRKYEGRSSLATYLTVIAERLLSDEWMRRQGRWRPSTEALRLGPAAVLLETLVRRDRRSFEEALPMVQTLDPTLSRRDVEAMLGRLPDRKVRPRETELEAAAGSLVAFESTDVRALANESRAVSELATRTLRDALASLPLEERMILKLRFAQSMSIADISRMLRLPQRPLYRRIETTLAALRRELAMTGIHTDDLEALFAAASVEGMDFGFTESPEQWQTKEEAELR